jgi:peptidoglycan/LPS O-acetylase OafA/YrhL
MPNGLPKDNETKEISALNGIRGYGFLAIFLAHYLSPVIEPNRSKTWVNCIYYAGRIVWLAVPTFFVLSGYLIGGILFKSRNREGFFRVFYGRRVLRVLPVCYLTLLVIGCVDIANGIHLRTLFWSHFFYIQNFMPGYTDADYPPNSQIIHLWSLAIEEQFYLSWPVVVWFARDRGKLLKIIAVLCAMCWTIRLVSPWIHLSPSRSYYATPTRVDAILLGVGLALVADHKMYKRFQPLAKYVVLVGLALWVTSFSTHPDHPTNYYRVAIEISLGNFIVLALLAAALEEGSALARACSVRWACWLGTMSLWAVCLPLHVSRVVSRFGQAQALAIYAGFPGASNDRSACLGRHHRPGDVQLPIYRAACIELEEILEIRS